MKTEIIVVLDKSGSMGRLRDDTIGGFNTLIEDQKEEQSNECLVTLVQFDDRYEVNYMARPIEDVQPLDHSTYQPRGSTALHDAIGKTINGVVNRHSAMSEPPGQTIFVIITDGQENASREFRGQAPGMIKTQQGEYDWDFIFLGADIDEMKTAEAYNIHINTVSSYSNTSSGIGSTYASTSKLMSETRDMYSRGRKRSARKMSEEVDWKAGIEGSQGTMEEE